MLAQLLRRLIAGQMLVGAGLGWLIANQGHGSLWLMPLLALLAPWMISLAVILMGAIKSRQPGHQALWWRSIAGEYRASTRVFLLQQPWTRSPPRIESPHTRPSAHPASPPVPVVLVHGYICNHRVWDALAARLLNAGHTVYRLDLEPLFTSIDDYASQLEQAVNELCRETGALKVALIGHSMGGLVIRAWMRSFGSERVQRVITLGTPHQGTRIDPHPKTSNGRQMGWHSDWLQTLAASETAATRQLMRIALTTQDSVVYPQLEQRLPGVPVTVFKGLGHLELSQNEAVAQWVLKALESGVQETPTPVFTPV
jgi:triacylglycerol lipase